MIGSIELTCGLVSKYSNIPPAQSIDGTFPITAPRALEQISVTKDVSDYLWYSTEVILSQASAAAGQAQLVITAQDYFYVFLDDVLLGAYLGGNSPQTLTLDVHGLSAGSHTLKVLCKTEGLINYSLDSFFQNYKRGVALGDCTRISHGDFPKLKSPKFNIRSNAL